MNVSPENNHTEEAYRHLLETMKYLRDNARNWASPKGKMITGGINHDQTDP